MSEHLSRADRQKIVDDFIEQHGHWDAAAFVEEVAKTKGQHPAWIWFTWDDGKAAHNYRLWEARTFVRDLVVRSSVETIEHGKVRVRQVETPLVISPVSKRQHGGGYIELNPDDPTSMGEFCAEAAMALNSWMKRYNAAVAHAGGSTAALKKLVAKLEAKAPKDKAA